MSYTFDAANMLTSAFEPGKGRVEYIYNGFGDRVSKREELSDSLDSVREVRYLLDMTLPYDNLLMEKGLQFEQKYTWGNGLVSGVSKTGFDREDAFFYLQDHLGSPIRILGGEVNQPLSYDSFGVEGHSPSIERFVNPFGFTGYQRENVGGMLYAQARYYDPRNGRFNAEDGARDGLNWYEYARSNPLRFVDPTGLVAHPSPALDSLRNNNPALWGMLQDPHRDGGAQITGHTSFGRFGSNGWNNDDPQVALDAIAEGNVSRYRGQWVVPLGIIGWFNGNRSFALGANFLASNADVETLRHEWGHNMQFRELGLARYLHGIGFPSMRAESPHDFYYSNPWERHADILGRVDRGSEHRYLYGSIPVSVLYYEWLRHSVILAPPLGRLAPNNLFSQLDIIKPEIGRWFNSMLERGCLE